MSGERVTVVLRCTAEQAAKHLAKHLPGAKTKQVERFLLIQHPRLDAMGCDGAEAVCVANQLPMRHVRLGEPL